MTLTKPCARAGCDQQITAPGPKTLAAKRFCSPRCVFRNRVAMGWKPPTLTRARCRRGGVKGGRIAGQRRRQRAARRILEQLEGLIPKTLLRDLSAEQIATVKVLMLRVFREANKIATHRQWRRRQSKQQGVAA